LGNYLLLTAPLSKSDEHRTRQCLCTKLSDHTDEWESSDHHAAGFESNMHHFGIFLLQTIRGRLSYAVDLLVCRKRTVVKQREFEEVVLVRFLVIERDIFE
jgi:hypothetical protein